MKTWLVSAFEPFDGAESNSSLIVLNELRKMDWGGRILFHGPVPVEFNNGWNDLAHALKANPHVDGVLALGQSERRPKMSLEYVALNWIDARTPDNRGIRPALGAIDKSLPQSRWTTIDWSKFNCTPEISARSYSAGTYVCNELLFKALGWSEENGKMAGFIHIPVLDELELSKTVGEMKRILEFLVQHD